MKKYARVDAGIVQEVIDTNGDIKEMFHPDMTWIEVGDKVRVGWTYIDGHFSAPPAVEPEPQVVTVFSSLEYFSKFTDEEYQAARTGTIRAQRALDMLIAAQAVDIVNDPRVPEALDIMIEDCGMTNARKAELLTPDAVIDP